LVQKITTCENMAETIYAASSKVKVRLSHKLGWGARILRNADFQSAYRRILFCWCAV